jgi:hypothetical protein
MFSKKPEGPNPSQERLLKGVSFIQIQDSECDDVQGWRVRVAAGDGSVVADSNRLFDSFPEAFEEFISDQSTVFGDFLMDCNHPLDLLPNLEAIRQQHEAFLTKLEALAVQAIAWQDWSPVIEFVENAGSFLP